MNDELKIALGAAKDGEQKTRSIFKYIQNNFTCTNYSKLYIDQSLKKPDEITRLIALRK